ncbi:type II toxin-antitoxin system VapC family toxin [bacterium]|nr:MAG: type II toxin-antitoxin system VapC family toxin [bacterium]
MIYLLDTNAISRYLGKRPSSVKERLEAQPRIFLATSTIVEAELYFGAIKGSSEIRTPLRRFLSGINILPFSSDAALRYGHIRTDLETNGEVIGGNDLLIGATALAHDLTLVTHNTGEFSRVPGLRVEDWE